MKKLRWFLKSLRPMYWMQNHPFSAAWDRLLNQLLDTENFANISRYTAELGVVVVWIDNHPYSSFRPYSLGYPNVRPSRCTIIRAHEQLMNDAFNAPAREQARLVDEISALERMWKK